MTGKSRLAAVLLMAAMVLSMGANGFAGWILVSEDGSSSILSKGRLKAVTDQGWLLLNAHTGRITIVDEDRKFCASGTVEDFCNAAKEMFDKALSQLPAERRQLVEQLMKGQDPQETANVTVVKQEGSETIAGHQSVKYTVFADGAPYEDLWLSTDRDLLAEAGPLLKMMQSFSSCSNRVGAVGSVPPEQTPEYKSLMDKGVPLRTIDRSQTEPRTVTEIKSIENRPIPDSQFETPAGFKQMRFVEMFGLMMPAAGEEE